MTQAASRASGPSDTTGVPPSWHHAVSPSPSASGPATTPDIFIHLCDPEVAEAILKSGWDSRRHRTSALPYIELTDPDIARSFMGTGVALKAKKAARDGMVLLQRSNGTFYTSGFEGKIDAWYAKAWGHATPNTPSEATRPGPPPRGTVARANRAAMQAGGRRAAHMQP